MVSNSTSHKGPPNPVVLNPGTRQRKTAHAMHCSAWVAYHGKVVQPKPAHVLARSNRYPQATKQVVFPSVVQYLLSTHRRCPPSTRLTKQADRHNHCSSGRTCQFSSRALASFVVPAASGKQTAHFGIAEENVLGGLLTISLAAGGIRALILRHYCVRVGRLLYFSKHALSLRLVRSVAVRCRGLTVSSPQRIARYSDQVAHEQP